MYDLLHPFNSIRKETARLHRLKRETRSKMSRNGRTWGIDRTHITSPMLKKKISCLLHPRHFQCLFCASRTLVKTEPREVTPGPPTSNSCPTDDHKEAKPMENLHKRRSTKPSAYTMEK